MRSTFWRWEEKRGKKNLGETERLREGPREGGEGVDRRPPPKLKNCMLEIKNIITYELLVKVPYSSHIY